MQVSYTYDYPRPALTVDVVIFSKSMKREVLLIKRKKDPFKNHWAFPGGFFDLEDADVAAATLRELHEETGIKLARSDLTQLGVWSEAGRDPRDRTISVVHVGQVDKASVAPVAADDAIAVSWFPVESLPLLAFDHAKILQVALDSIQKTRERL